jgi:hypothetical protein
METKRVLREIQLRVRHIEEITKSLSDWIANKKKELEEKEQTKFKFGDCVQTELGYGTVLEEDENGLIYVIQKDNTINRFDRSAVEFIAKSNVPGENK